MPEVQSPVSFKSQPRHLFHTHTSPTSSRLVMTSGFNTLSQSQPHVFHLPVSSTVCASPLQTAPVIKRVVGLRVLSSWGEQKWVKPVSGKEVSLKPDLCQLLLDKTQDVEYTTGLLTANGHLNTWRARGLSTLRKELLPWMWGLTWWLQLVTLVKV